MTKKKKKRTNEYSRVRSIHDSVFFQEVYRWTVGGIYVVYSIFGNDIYYVAAHVTTP